MNWISSISFEFSDGQQAYKLDFVAFTHALASETYHYQGGSHLIQSNPIHQIYKGLLP